MIQLILILIIAGGLLTVVGVLLRDALRRRATLDDYAIMQTGPTVCPVEVPPAALMDRIFAEEDLSFVTGEAGRPIRRQFLRDRRRIALSWLGLTRREAIRILRLHLRAVRTNRSLQPFVEFRLLAHTLLFFVVYTLLWSIVATYGAFWARGFVRSVVALAGRLTWLGATILAETDRSGPRLVQSHGNA